MTYTAEMFADLARTAHEENAALKMAHILNGTALPEDNERVNDRLSDRYARQSRQEKMLIAFDALFDCHGIEAIRVEGAWVDNYHGDVIASYVNTGDTYCLTLVLDHETGELILTSYGDWLEEWEATHEREGA